MPIGMPVSASFVDRVKSATESVTSSVALQADDHLTFADVAVGTYAVIGALVVDGAAAGDFQAQYSGTATMADSQVALDGLVTTAGSASGSVNTGANGPAVTMTRGTIGAGAPVIYQVAGVLIVTAAGSVTLSWAQAVSDVTPTRLLKGSWISLRRLGA